jgi:hypothetical protein
MSYVVRIRDTATGEERDCPMRFDWFKPDGGDDEFWWTEGNFSCDCNRELEFRRAAGEDPDANSVECNVGSNRFKALHATLPDGRLIPIDT